MTRSATPFTPEYIQQIFTIWYGAGRPNQIYKILDKLPKDNLTGRIPDVSSIQKWRIKYGWDAQADELDEKALVLVQNDLIQRKADMLSRQADIGFQLQYLGMAYLVSGSFDSSASAVQAIKVGAELERSSRGISDLIMKISKMSDDELQQEILNQISRASESGQIVEGEEVDTGDGEVDTRTDN